MEKEESGRERRQIPEAFEKVWSQALLAMSTAEEEASRVMSRVADLSGWSQEEVRRHLREFSERLLAQRRDLERNVEEGVRRALLRLRVPRREELAALSSRLDDLGKRVETLSKK